MHESSTETIITALEILSKGIVSDDGVASAALMEASERLTELNDAIHKTVEDSNHIEELDKIIKKYG